MGVTSSRARSGWPVTYSAVARAATHWAAAGDSRSGQRASVRRASSAMSSARPWWTIAPEAGAQGVGPARVVVVGRAPAQGLGQVVEGGHEVAEEAGSPAAGGAAGDLPDRGDDVVGEAVVGGLERAAAAQAVEGELPDGLEQAVPRLGPARVDGDERGVGELVEQGVEP